jgi:hypothetical protein
MCAPNKWFKQTLGKLQRNYKIDRGSLLPGAAKTFKGRIKKELSLSTKESPFSIVESPRISCTPLKTRKMKRFLNFFPFAHREWK